MDLSHIENEKTEINIDILNKIISNFDIDAHWILSGKEKMPQKEHKMGEVSNSTVVGANVSGNGICIHHNS
jgi:hypothetical protein